MIDRYKGMIQIALDEAKSSDFRIKMGCVIFSKKKVLSTGKNGMRNRIKLHPKFQKFKGSIHAEVDTIISARKDLKGSTLLVIRINNKGEFRLSKPCGECMKYIQYVGIKKLIYSISTYPYFEEVLL